MDVIYFQHRVDEVETNSGALYLCLEWKWKHWGRMEVHFRKVL